MSHALRCLALWCILAITACGRSQLPSSLESSAGSGGTSAPVTAPSAGAPQVPAVCGDGVIESGEQCDRNTLGGATCTTLGFNAGSVRCGRDCRLDTSGCVAMTPPDTLTSAQSRCPAPESPVEITRPCIDQLCACDRAALLRCDFVCWQAVACRVEACNRNPARQECTQGCAQSTDDALSLGRCFEASPMCFGR